MKFKILDNHQIEFAGMNEDDLMILEGVAFHDGVNENRAVINKEDAKKDIHTMVGKPLRVLWNNNSPTGHGYNKLTDSFDERVNNIGYIHNAFVDDTDQDGYEAKVQAVVWKKYYPDITKGLYDLHNKGDLNFSIEAERDVEELPDNVRRCYNLNFTGLSIVAHPAWQNTKSLMVAEDENANEENTGGQDMGDEIKTQEVKQEGDSLEAKEALLNKQIQVMELEKQVQALTDDVAEYRRVVDSYKKKEKGAERLEKLKKYGEVKDSIEELGNLSDEDFLVRFEETLDVYAKSIETAKTQKEKEADNPISTLIHDRKETKVGKDALLSMLKGMTNE